MYLFGASEKEILRLRLQAELFEEESIHTLQLAGIKSGMDCVDIGCGSGETTILIAKLVGKDGSVTGVDLSEQAIRAAEKRVKEEGLQNIRFVVGDAHNTKLDGNYDLVFSRFLFQHLKDPALAIKEMKRLAKKGIIVTEELDHAFWISFPEIDAVEKLRYAYTELLRRNGYDPLVARKLYSLFIDAGLDSNVEGYAVSVLMKSKYNVIPRLFAEVMRDNIINSKLMTEIEFKSVLTELDNFSKMASAMVLYPLAFRVWGTPTY